MSGWPTDAPFQWGDTVRVANGDLKHTVVGVNRRSDRVNLDGYGWVTASACTLVKPDVIVWRNVYPDGTIGVERRTSDAAAKHGPERTHVLEYNVTDPSKSVLHDVRGES